MVCLVLGGMAVAQLRLFSYPGLLVIVGVYLVTPLAYPIMLHEGVDAWDACVRSARRLDGLYLRYLWVTIVLAVLIVFAKAIVWGLLISVGPYFLWTLSSLGIDGSASIGWFLGDALKDLYMLPGVALGPLVYARLRTPIAPTEPVDAAL